MAGSLECQSNHALVLRAATSFFVRHDFGVRGHKAAQGLTVFVVYRGNFVGAEVAILLYHWDVSIALLRSHKLGCRG